MDKMVQVVVVGGRGVAQRMRREQGEEDTGMGAVRLGPTAHGFPRR